MATQQYAILQSTYPVIAKGNVLYKLSQTINSNQEIQKHSNNIIEEKDELEYLEELQTFMTTEYNSNMNKIKSKIEVIEKTKKLDLSMLEKLPADCMYEIKSYLQPEIEYSKKFMILRSIKTRYSGSWDIEYELMAKVPKKLIMNLIEKCKIYPELYVKSKDLKHKWCLMIEGDTDKIVNTHKLGMRVDKLLANHNEEYSSSKEKRIDKWYKFFLYICVYRKYRAELENSITNQNDKLTKLKNTKISVK
jgi:hypothetical protein